MAKIDRDKHARMLLREATKELAEYKRRADPEMLWRCIANLGGAYEFINPRWPIRPSSETQAQYRERMEIGYQYEKLQQETLDILEDLVP